MRVDGELDDRELRLAIQDYLRTKYGVEIHEATIRLEVVREAEPLKNPAEYRVTFRGDLKNVPRS